MARGRGRKARSAGHARSTHMATILEKMLTDSGAHFPLATSNRAVDVLRADAEMDRLRNLISSDTSRTRKRATAGQPASYLHDPIARARGDHAKNLAKRFAT